MESGLEAKVQGPWTLCAGVRDRKSTRLNSSHTVSSYAVFCLKKKNLDRAPVLGARDLLDAGDRPDRRELGETGQQAALDRVRPEVAGIRPRARSTGVALQG